MMYEEIKPCKELSPYINCYWFFQGDDGALVRDCTFPDGSLEIIFNIGTKVTRSLHDGPFTTNPPSELIGQMTVPYEVHFQGVNRFIGIRFFPHSFSCFTRMPLHELADLTVDPREALGKEFQPLAERIHSEECHHKAIAALEKFLLKRIDEHRVDQKYHLLNHVTKLLLKGEVNSIEEIITDVKCKERHLQRVFSERVGVNPRFLLKVLRFQRSFTFLNRPSLSLTDVAYECGYFDQAHFNRDFKYFSRTTPSEYRTRNYPINKYFLTDESQSYLYGAEVRVASEKMYR